MTDLTCHYIVKQLLNLYDMDCDASQLKFAWYGLWCVTTEIAWFIFHPTTTWAPNTSKKLENQLFLQNSEMSSHSILLEIEIHKHRLGLKWLVIDTQNLHLICSIQNIQGVLKFKVKTLPAFWLPIINHSYRSCHNYFSIS